MPRPVKPLITYDSVIETALRIIDTEGLEAFSLPRLARELNVRAPSLYHHFQDKAEILRGVARAIVLEARMPDERTTPNWIEWFVALSLNFRAVVLRHRNAAPVLLQFMPREILTHVYDACAQFMAEIGVPPEQRILLLDGLDRLTLGAAISEAVRVPRRTTLILGDADPGVVATVEPGVFANVDPIAEPALAAALAANRRTTDELFAESLRSFLRGAAPYVAADAAPPNRAVIAGRPLVPLQQDHVDR